MTQIWGSPGNARVAACRGVAVAVAGAAGGIRHKARVIDNDDGIVSDDAPHMAAVKQRSR